MAIASIVFDPLDGSEALVSASTADSKAVSSGVVGSTADSKAVVADSIADEALDDASDALVDASEAKVDASTADSKAVVSDSKAVSAGVVGSTADSKAVVADSIADEAKEKADSAIGSEPDAGEFKVTDVKRNADGSLVVDYDDSAIDS